MEKILFDEMANFIVRIESILDDNEIDNSDIIYVKFFLQTLGSKELMKHCVKKILPWKEKIVSRDINFFIDNKEIFGKLPENKVNYFSDLFKNNKLQKEDIDEIWEFFNVFITIIETHGKNE